MLGMRSDLTISAIGHVVLLLWGLLTFSAAPLTAAAPDSLPIDIVSDKQFSELMAGTKSAPKADAPKPLVDKVDTPKPNPTPEPVPTVVEKPEIAPIPKEAPPEQKPPEPKQAEAKPEPTPKPKADPIAEALKKEDARKAAEAKAKAKAGAQKKQPQFNADQIAEMLDKRNPQRHASTGETLNKDPTLGIAAGSAAVLSQSEVDALRIRLMQLWNPPVASNPEELMVKIRIKLGRDRKLVAPPLVLTSGRGSLFEAARDRAVRALFEGQPFDMLKPEHYELWKEMEITFDPREMTPG